MPPADNRRDSRLVVVAVSGDPVVRSFLRTCLERASLPVVTFTSGLEAISSDGQGWTPGVVVLDDHALTKDGVELWQTLKARPEWKKAPLLFVAASIRRGRAQSPFFDVLEADYLAKPIHPEELVGRVRHYFRMREEQVTLAEENVLLGRKLQCGMEVQIALGRMLAIPIVIVNQEGRVLFLSDSASTIIRATIPEWEMKYLPTELLDGQRLGDYTAQTVAHGGAAGVRVIRLAVASTVVERDGNTSLRALGLTNRQAEVLHWLALGKRNRDIAEILGLRPATVKKHVWSILNALGVETRLAAALVANEVDPVRWTADRVK